MAEFPEGEFSALIAVCTYSQVKTRCIITHHAIKACPNPKIEVHYQDGDALISRSRSIVATNFLTKSKYDYLFFLDEDIVISTLDVTKILQESHQMKLDINGAAYVTKSKENPGLAVQPLFDTKMEFGKNGKLYPMKRISTGCMCIHRSVLQNMIDEGKVKKCLGNNGNFYYPFFKQDVTEDNGVIEDMSEDWYFCDQARKLGFKIWCDSTIKLGHIGFYEYTWDDLYEVKRGIRKKYDSAVFTAGTNTIIRMDIDLTGKINKDKVPFLGDFRQELKQLVGIK